MIARVLAFAFALAFASCSIAAAAVVTVVQVKDCGSAGVTTCTFVSTPTNGNVVVILKAGTTTTANQCNDRDSNSVVMSIFLANESGGTSGMCADEYTVSGSPTATYSFGGTMSGMRGSMWELLGSSVNPSLGLPNGQHAPCAAVTTCTDSVFSQSATTTIQTGSLLICAASTSTGLTSGISSTVGGLTALSTNTTLTDSYLVIGSPAVSATCTGTASSSATITTMTIGIPPPNPTAGGGMVGDVLFERLAAHWN